ncbi:MAG: DUF2147 domain-containing protein [Betaproteobacteria bacterium]|jgi:uncharacterized protein (DUF2147 family)|nr:DUF2147 domain-containing protein [Betaproteobacteria bacterium]
MKKMLSALLCLVTASAFAQMTPVGVWHTIDDETNQPKGEVRIFEKEGALVGVVGRALKEDPNAKPNCDKCEDDRKGQPIIGMEILRGLKREGKEDEYLWAGGGKILDPTNGKIYTVKMVPVEGGKRLRVRGYIGPFYRTQFWNRVE